MRSSPDPTELNLSLFEDDFSEFYDLLNASDYAGNRTFEPDRRTVACEASGWTRPVGSAACAFYLLVFLLAIPGNCVVGLVIGLGKRPFLPFDLYLIHLAVADTLLALTLPFWATAAVAGWVFGNGVCKLLSLLQEATFYSSILFLACISADRYLVVVRAVEARKERRQSRCWAACLAVWTLGGALSLPSLYNESFRPRGSEQAVCTEYYDPGQRGPVAAGHARAQAPAGLRAAAGLHAGLLRAHGGAAPPHAGHAEAPGREDDGRRAGGLPRLLGPVPPVADGGHAAEGGARALRLRGQDVGVRGPVRHAGRGPAALLHQPHPLRLRRGEVSEELAAAAREEGGPGAG